MYLSLTGYLNGSLQPTMLSVVFRCSSCRGQQFMFSVPYRTCDGAYPRLWQSSYSRWGASHPSHLLQRPYHGAVTGSRLNCSYLCSSSYLPETVCASTESLHPCCSFGWPASYSSPSCCQRLGCFLPSGQLKFGYRCSCLSWPSLWNYSNFHCPAN